MPFCYSWDHKLVIIFTAYYAANSLLYLVLYGLHLANPPYDYVVSVAQRERVCCSESRRKRLARALAARVAPFIIFIVVLPTMMLDIDSYLVMLLSSLVHNTRDIVCIHFT